MNSVNVSLKISKDFDNRKAVRVVSDKLTVLNCFLPGKKNPDGTYGPSASVEVSVTASTKNSVVLEPGKSIDVTGFLASREYTTKDGQKRTYMAIVATEIAETQYTGNDAKPATQPAAPASASTTTAAPAADVDDLPFV